LTGIKISGGIPCASLPHLSSSVSFSYSLSLKAHDRGMCAYRSSLVDRMPVLDEATFNVRRAGHFPASASTMAQFSVSLPNGVEKPAVDLLFDEDFFQDLLCVYLGSSLSQSG